MSENEVRRKLASETGTLPWAELQRHFARGVVVVVASDLDLVDVATHMAGDDAAALQAWADADRVVRATDEHARRWEASGQFFKAVVVAPWVLVQEARLH